MKTISSVFSLFAALACSIAITSCDISALQNAPPAITTTTIVADFSGPEILKNSGFDSHAANAGPDSEIDVWTDWAETLVRPENGFTSLFDYPSASDLAGRKNGDMHAAILFTSEGNAQTSLKQSVAIAEWGTYRAQVWVLGGYTKNTFVLSVKQNSVVVGSTESVIDCSDVPMATVTSYPPSSWSLLEVQVTLVPGQTEIILETSISTTGTNRFARFDDASLKKL